jgi:hypothetical protein
MPSSSPTSAWDSEAAEASRVLARTLDGAQTFGRSFKRLKAGHTERPNTTMRTSKPTYLRDRASLPALRRGGASLSEGVAAARKGPRRSPAT